MTGLIALRSQPPKVDAREAEAIALDLYGVIARAVPLEGERDRNFRLDTSDGRQLVLKFVDHEADDCVVAGQSAVLAHLAEQDAGPPVPRVVATRNGHDLGLAAGCRVRLVTYLSGDPVPGVEPSAKLLRSVGTQIGRLDRALRGFYHPALAQPIAWDIRRAPSLLPVIPLVASPIARRLVSDALEPLPRLLRDLRGLRSQAIHGDCHPRNLLVNEAGDECVGIIDLGDMIHAPLALEIAVTMAEFLTSQLPTDSVASVDHLAQILAGYAGVQPLERGDIDVLYDVVAARIAIGVLISAWRASNQPAAAIGAITPTGETDVEQIALRAFGQLAARGRDSLTKQWHEAVAACKVPAKSRSANGPDLLRRRRTALGANAELSYERPLHLVRGEGLWVYTAAGERLLDVYNNVPHVGHAHPAVVAAIAEQTRLISSNTRYLDERIIEYVERLTATLPPDLDTCLFVNSGSEANDIAWRIARSHTGHAGALVMTYAYHGITDAVTALSPAICAKPPPTHVEQLAAPSGRDDADMPAGGDTPADTTADASADADVHRALARLADRGFDPAALLIDSALTSTGIYDPPRGWVAPIVAAVRQAGGLIIADEVQIGLGRSGSDFWGFNRRGMQPDIVTLGKPVGNGYPMGVVITRRAILERFQRDTGFFSTFGGNPVAAAAGLAVLDVLEREHLVENARATGDYFIRGLRELAGQHNVLGDVRGCGLLLGVEIDSSCAAPTTKHLVNRLRDFGVLIGSEGPRGNVLKLRPPMPFGAEHADIVLAALSAACQELPPSSCRP